MTLLLRRLRPSDLQPTAMTLKGQQAAAESDSLLNQPRTHSPCFCSSSRLLTPPNSLTAPYAAVTSGRSHPAGPSTLPAPAHYQHAAADQVHHQDGALGAADLRARKRVLMALLYGFAIWIGIGLITGGIVVDATQRGARIKAAGR